MIIIFKDSQLFHSLCSVIVLVQMHSGIWNNDCIYQIKFIAIISSVDGEGVKGFMTNASWQSISRTVLFLIAISDRQSFCYCKIAFYTFKTYIKLHGPPLNLALALR